MMRFGRHFSYILLLVAAYALPMTTSACTGGGGGTGYGGDTDTIPAELADAPRGTMLTSWSKVGGYVSDAVTGCHPSERVAISGSLSIDGLRPAGTISVEGFTYTAFQTTTTSPMYIFRHQSSVGVTPQGQLSTVPITDFSRIHNPGAIPPPGNTDTRRIGYMEFAVVASGGLMTSSSSRSIFSGYLHLDAYPSLSIYSGYSGGWFVQPATCNLADIRVDLADIRAVDIVDAPGPSAYSKPFNVAMTCNGNGTRLRLTISDAVDTANRTADLAPATESSTSRGVRLQILRAGTPLLMRSSWTATSGKGTTTIPLSTRYNRTEGEFRSGTISSRATLTVNYN